VSRTVQESELLPLMGPASFELDADINVLGMALIEILKLRGSQREFSERELSWYRLSRLLWAANGCNRETSGHRTAPSVCNAQEIDIYIAMASGLYRYDAQAPALMQQSSVDMRPLTGKQDFVARAPVNLLYVANLSRMPPEEQAKQLLFAALDVGHISQNVYLFCAAEGLAAVARGWFDQEELAEAMALTAGQHVMLAQSVGYPLVSQSPPPASL
jgi:SagB-type dehydrogenase family enzyme